MAILANELRLGNYILDAHTGQKYAIEITCLMDLEDERCDVVFEGIPLTPDLLEKCGFDKKALGHDNTPCFVKPYKRRDCYDVKHELALLNYNISGKYPADAHHWAVGIREYDRDIQFAATSAEFVHTLQNIYHALTGEELDIKL